MLQDELGCQGVSCDVPMRVVAPVEPCVLGRLLKRLQQIDESDPQLVELILQPLVWPVEIEVVAALSGGCDDPSLQDRIDLLLIGEDNDNQRHAVQVAYPLDAAQMSH